MADKKDCTVGQLMLVWETAQGDDFFSIPGTWKLIPEENLRAAGVKLSKEEVAEIRKLCAAAEMHGERIAACFQMFILTLLS